MDTPSARRNMVLDLIKLGLFTNDNGRLDAGMKAKALELLGFGSWEHAQDLTNLHIGAAQKENLDALAGNSPEVSENDNHEVHIAEHTAQLLVRKSEMLEAHVREHRRFMSAEKQINELTEERNGKH